jgi:hypothetical protein
MQTIFEDFFMLCIHEDKGTVVKSAEGALRYGLAGAILSELALQNRLRVDAKHRLEVTDTTPIGDPVLDEALQKIQQASEAQKVGAWVKSLSKGSGDLREALTARLVQAGIVTEEETRLLWVTPYPAGQEGAASARYWLKNDLRATALACVETDVRRLALLVLVQSCDLLSLAFTKDERKVADRHIYEMLMGEGLRSPVVQTLQEVGEAVESLVAVD